MENEAIVTLIDVLTATLIVGFCLAVLFLMLKRKDKTEKPDPKYRDLMASDDDYINYIADKFWREKR